MIDRGPLDSAIFRFNPSWQLAQLDSLNPSLRELVRDADAQDDHFGFLVPCDPSNIGTVKAVDQQIALLLLSVREPGSLPPPLIRVGGEEMNRVVRTLVLDNVLEVRLEGQFVSGPAGCAAISDPEWPLFDGASVDSLSVRALHHAARLPIDEPLALSARLYFYNRAPLTPKLLNELPDEQSVARQPWVREAVRQLVTAGFEEGRGSTATSRPWRFFRRKDNNSAADHPRWKLYFSPNWNATPAGFVELVKLLPRTNTLALKFGRTIGEFLRPDKIVLYFGSACDADEACVTFASAFPSDIAQGVPFAEVVANEGLFAKGLDPEDSSPLEWLPAESWRSWITNRLAVALIHAKQTDLGSLDAWEFALLRIREEGISPETWSPVAAQPPGARLR